MDQYNEVRLTGLITKIYPSMTTPSGVKVARIVVEHVSEQVEGGIKRKVRCKIYCVMVPGEIDEVMLDSHVEINGFLSINTQKQLVLHITNLKNLDLKEI